MARRFADVLFRPTPLGFCLRGGLLLLVLSVCSLTPPFERWVYGPLKVLDAWLTHLCLAVLGVSTRQEGVHVHGGFSIEVIDECTGVSALLILTALTLAFPTSWRRRLIGLVAGTSLIFVLNLGRLVSLFLIGMNYPELFHDLHIFVWQGIFIVIVFLYWYVWAYRAGRAPAAPETQSAPGS